MTVSFTDPLRTTRPSADAATFFSLRYPRVTQGAAQEGDDKPQATNQLRVEQHRPPPQDIRAALSALSGEDLLRLRAIARLRARSLPGDVSWSDLLQEAVVRTLAGTRAWPPGLPLLAFLAGIMRSLCHEHWRRHRLRQTMALPGPCGSDNPERVHAATQASAAIHRLFASDEAASAVITGLIGGMAADEIHRHYCLTTVEYDTTRRRIRHAMLRHGLAWSRP